MYKHEYMNAVTESVEYHIGKLSKSLKTLELLNNTHGVSIGEFVDELTYIRKLIERFDGNLELVIGKREIFESGETK